MNELLRLVRIDALPLQRFEHKRFNGLGGVTRRGERFTDGESAGCIIEYDEVGERASDIDAYPEMPGVRLHYSASSLGKRLKGKIST